MLVPSFVATLTVDADPRALFDAILDARSWWSGAIDGDTDRVGAVFRYRYGAMHDSTQRVERVEPHRMVVWRVTDATLSFVQRAHEWKDTEIVFEIEPHPRGATLRFEHRGLLASCECYEACSRGWSALLHDNLRRRAERGVAQPDVFAADTQR